MYLLNIEEWFCDAKGLEVERVGKSRAAFLQHDLQVVDDGIQLADPLVRTLHHEPKFRELLVNKLEGFILPSH